MALKSSSTAVMRGHKDIGLSTVQHVENQEPKNNNVLW